MYRNTVHNTLLYVNLKDRFDHEFLPTIIITKIF